MEVGRFLLEFVRPYVTLHWGFPLIDSSHGSPPQCFPFGSPLPHSFGEFLERQEEAQGGN